MHQIEPSRVVQINSLVSSLAELIFNPIPHHTLRMDGRSIETKRRVFPLKYANSTFLSLGHIDSQQIPNYTRIYVLIHTYALRSHRFNAWPYDVRTLFPHRANNSMGFYTAPYKMRYNVRPAEIPCWLNTH